MTPTIEYKKGKHTLPISKNTFCKYAVPIDEKVWCQRLIIVVDKAQAKKCKTCDKRSIRLSTTK